MVDTKNQDMSNYGQDLYECQEYAKNINPAQSAAGGAAVGAVLSAVIAGILGGDKSRAAAVGAVTGALSGGAAGGNNQKTVISNCLLGRGYKVLN